MFGCLCGGVVEAGLLAVLVSGSTWLGTEIYNRCLAIGRDHGDLSKHVGEAEILQGPSVEVIDE